MNMVDGKALLKPSDQANQVQGASEHYPATTSTLNFQPPSLFLFCEYSENTTQQTGNPNKVILFLPQRMRFERKSMYCEVNYDRPTNGRSENN